MTLDKWHWTRNLTWWWLPIIWQIAITFTLALSDATVHTVVYTHIVDISYLKHQVESKRKDNQASSIMSWCFWCHMLLVFVLLKMLPLLYLLFWSSIYPKNYFKLFGWMTGRCILLQRRKFVFSVCDCINCCFMLCR